MTALQPLWDCLDGPPSPSSKALAEGGGDDPSSRLGLRRDSLTSTRPLVKGAGGGGVAQGLGIRLFAFGGAYWPLATARGGGVREAEGVCVRVCVRARLLRRESSVRGWGGWVRGEGGGGHTRNPSKWGPRHADHFGVRCVGGKHVVSGGRGDGPSNAEQVCRLGPPVQRTQLRFVEAAGVVFGTWGGRDGHTVSRNLKGKEAATRTWGEDHSADFCCACTPLYDCKGLGLMKNHLFLDSPTLMELVGSGGTQVNDTHPYAEPKSKWPVGTCHKATYQTWSGVCTVFG